MGTSGKSAGVIYFNHGRKHTVRLAVSMASLRRFHPGAITILDTGASEGVVDRLAADRNILAKVQTIPFEVRRRNSCYCAKASLWRYSPYDTTLFLDADTVVARPVDELFSLAPNYPTLPILTQFSGWTTHGNLVASRIRKWVNKKVTSPTEDIQEMAKQALHCKLPAVNTGVMAWIEPQSWGGRWEEITHAGWRTPFTDELAMQLLITEIPHILLDDRYNCSPIYGAHKREAVIWHMHGNKQCRPEALPIWWPLYEDCLRENIGGIREWSPAGDKRLRAYLDQLNQPVSEG